MLVTNDSNLAERARYLSQQAKDDPIEYIHNEIGYNYRLTNIQAAMGCAQMEQLDGFIAKKRKIAETYTEGLAGIPGITTPLQADWATSTFWLYTILVNKSEFGLTSRDLMSELKKQNIQSRPLWHPIHKLPPFKDCQAFDVYTADILYKTALSIPSSSQLGPECQGSVISTIKKACTA